jgi:hypothetical protein
MVDIKLAANFIEQSITADTKFGFERILWIIHAGVDYFAVVTARLQTESTVFLENKDIFIELGYFGGDCQPHHAGPDNNNIDFSGHEIPL